LHAARKVVGIDIQTKHVRTEPFTSPPFNSTYSKKPEGTPSRSARGRREIRPKCMFKMKRTNTSAIKKTMYGAFIVVGFQHKWLLLLIVFFHIGRSSSDVCITQVLGADVIFIDGPSYIAVSGLICSAKAGKRFSRDIYTSIKLKVE
jgi:hypothetical protein